MTSLNDILTDIDTEAERLGEDIETPPPPPAAPASAPAAKLTPRDAAWILAASVHATFGVPDWVKPWLDLARNSRGVWKDLPAVEAVLNTALEMAESNPDATNDDFDAELHARIDDGRFKGRLDENQLATIMELEMTHAEPEDIAAILVAAVEVPPKRFRIYYVSDLPDPGPDKDDPDCLLQNRFLRRGQCSALLSTSGVGKSSFTMQDAVMWGFGAACLGLIPTRPFKTGIVQTEDDDHDLVNFRDGIRRGLMRVHRWTHEQILAGERNYRFIETHGERGQALIDLLREVQLEEHFDLIILNPFFAFFDGDMNDNSQLSVFLRQQLDPFLKDPETKCACLIVHHTGKPNKDLLAMGQTFAAYLGNGGSEFTNYIRSALAIMPYEGPPGRKLPAIPGAFRLIGAKHGDKLRWKDANGNRVYEKVATYANLFAEYHKEGEDDPLLWVEPTPEQLEQLHAKMEAQKPSSPPRRASGKKTSAAEPPLSLDDCERRLNALIQREWDVDKKPDNAKRGQADWVVKGLKNADGCGNKKTRREVYEKLLAHPALYGLRLYNPKEDNPKDNRKPFLIPLKKPEQGELADLHAES